MDKALLFLGLIIIIFGILISYLLVASAINLGKSVKGQYSGLPQLQQNEIYIFTPINIVIVLIGIIILREGFKR